MKILKKLENFPNFFKITKATEISLFKLKKEKKIDFIMFEKNLRKKTMFDYLNFKKKLPIFLKIKLKSIPSLEIRFNLIVHLKRQLKQI